MANALKKINARAKQLSKMPKNKNKKYSTLRKQASSEWNSGKLKASKPKKARKKKTVKRRKVASVGAVKRKRRAPRRRKVTTGVQVRTRTRTVTKIRRVGAKKGLGTLGLVALVAGVGALVYMVSKSSTPSTVYIPTANAQRNTTAQNIIAYATAAGLAANQIAQLIKSLNSSSDSQVLSMQATLNSSPDPTALLMSNPTLQGGLVPL